jgi:hypothetical protein
MTGTVIDDIRSLDPVSYIRQVGLHPEDSYGFIPTKLDEGAAAIFLYRDSPSYEAARPKLAPPVEATRLGPIRIEPTQRVEMEVEGDQIGGALDDIVAQAQQMQQMWGGVPGGQPAQGAPGDALSAPDPARLERLAKLRDSGAISDDEYTKLISEETTITMSPAGESTGAPSGGAPIVAQRLYPGIRMRSSLRQLNHFLPKYVETVGLRPEDAYGVFPWGTRTTTGGEAGVGGIAWDDYWIVYRDRPEYESARDAYAADADKKGRWPEAVISPGVGDAPAAGPEVGKLKVEKEGWPRKALVVKESGPELAESIREKLSEFGYEPEDSFGFCPNFEHNRIYFGWRKS